MVMQIKRLRAAAGYSLSGFSAQLGVSPSVVANWETEVALPRTRQLPDLARVLGCSIGELFTEAGE